MKYIKEILLIAILLLLGYILVSRPEPIKPINTKIIENRIKLVKDTITIYDNKINTIYKSNDIIESKLDALSDSIKLYRSKKDTIRIIQYQDTTITKLKESNDTLKRIITYKDSIVLKKDYIISSQDTIINSNLSEVKKFKKQRNISIAIVVSLVAKEVINLIKK